MFLTGHTGFKGSWLSLWLQEMNAEVTGFSLAPSSTNDLFVSARVGEGMTSVIGDIRDAAHLSTALAKAQPEIVIHLAAQALVRSSYEDPVETYSTNVMGLINVLESVRRTQSVRAVVNVTSDKSYENREWHWGYRETDPMGGYDPYSSSKGCAELVTSAWRSSYFSGAQAPALASARAGNVIGGGDWARDRLIPDVFRAIQQGRPAVIRNPCSIRPWQHVLEPLAGYLDLARRLYSDGHGFAEAWNFGPADADARSVRSVVEHVVALWGDGATWAAAADPGPHEATYLKLDSSKARSRLNWEPVWRLDEALRHLTEWYRRNAAGSCDVRAMTVEHINRYEADGSQLGQKTLHFV